MANEININESFKYFLKDKKLIKKTCIFYALCALMLTKIAILFVAPLFVGYYTDNAHTRIFKPTDNILEWKNFKRLIIIGFKFYVAHFVIVVSVSMLTYPFYILNMISMNSPVFLFLLIVQFTILFFALSVYMLAAQLAFIADPRFSSFFNTKVLKHIIKSNLFISYYVKVLICIVIFNILCTLLCKQTILIFFFPILAFYYMLVLGDIQAQYARAIFKINTKIQSEVVNG